MAKDMEERGVRCLTVCRMEPGALNFPTVEPLEEPKAAPERGLARGTLVPPL